MQTYIVLLRAINVGRTGKLPMSALRELCAELGFLEVATYIQSGNVVFTSRRAAKSVQKLLSGALATRLEKPVGVLLRTPGEIEATLARNPYPQAAPNQLLIMFLDEAVPAAEIAAIRTPGTEQIRASGTEVFIHFPDGQGQSKLRLPFAERGTARNLNTVRKLLAMGRELESR